MSKERMKRACECGCGQQRFFNQMVMVEVETAIDHDIRKTGAKRRFYVARECKEPFEQELALTVMLQGLSRAWAPRRKTLWQRINIPLTFWNWFRRINAARQVLRIQHGIWERTRGFEYAKVHAQNSAILFGAPRFMQGFLARRFMRRLRAAKEKSERPSNSNVLGERIADFK